MMNLSAKEDKLWFKLLDPQNDSIDGQPVVWDVPDSTDQGEWMEIPYPAGTWLVSDPALFFQPNFKVYVAQPDDEPVAEMPGIVWVRKFRMIRLATSEDLLSAGVKEPEHYLS